MTAIITGRTRTVLSPPVACLLLEPLVAGLVSVLCWEYSRRRRFAKRNKSITCLKTIEMQFFFCIMHFEITNGNAFQIFDLQLFNFDYNWQTLYITKYVVFSLFKERYWTTCFITKIFKLINEQIFKLNQ